ncbi:MAG: polysaccharide deacetylase family protein [Oscillospiraceae bacterium]|jgi:peptidoglycan/xylan/chitin deacetylase (PgdA/CDA1 family)|nr:polysaccharide deacetylase family protein [Oscillospiraceae bacterium]
MKKKTLSIILIICVVCILLGALPTASASETIEAELIEPVFTVNDKQVELRSYLIDGDIYINIFELALLFQNTEKNFSPMWDSFHRVIYITDGQFNDDIYTNLFRLEHEFREAERTAPQIRDSFHRITNINIGQNQNRPGLTPPSRVANTNSAGSDIIRVFINNREANITSYRVGNGVYSNIFQLAKSLDFCIRVSAMDENIDITTGLSNSYSFTGRRTIDPDKPMVALTFDDGPVEQTKELLDVLEEFGVLATFYVVGSKMTNNRDIIQRMFDMGNEIANHSWSHINLRNNQPSTVRSQLLRTNNAIEAITGVAPASMRPPWGEINADGRDVVAEFGMYVALWSLDPQDWFTQDADETFTRVITNVKDKDIILFHDTVPSTVEAIERLIPSLLDRGYQLVTVSELMYYSNITPASGSIVRDARPR